MNLSKLTSMYIDTFPEEAAEFCEERGFEILCLKEPRKDPTSASERYDELGKYDLIPWEKE